MKIISSTTLHYGSPYLAYALRSVLDVVDEAHIFYAPTPSFGQLTTLPVPESECRDALYTIAESAVGNKLRWHDGDWHGEGDQRDAIHQLGHHADVILIVDYDEIWVDPLRSIQEGLETRAQYVRHNIIHYWRSFHRAILHDPAYPVRLIIPNAPIKVDPSHAPTVNAAPINHMGYAIPAWLCRYKIDIHGHKNEWRKDIDWYHEVFLANRQYDCHPVGSDHWTPETVDPADYMPDFMRDHPYAGMEVIR